MTYRIAISVLLTVWAILIVAGVTAYWTTRSVLVADLDASMVARATPLTDADRYVVKNQVGETVTSSTLAKSSMDSKSPQLLGASFGVADGRRVRTVTVRIYVPNAAGTIEARSVIISEPTAELDSLLNRLAWALLITGGAAGIVAAFVARAVAKITLGPLRNTAETIGAIDETNLGKRIDESKLSIELAPVAQRLNQMLARLEQSFASRKRFLADASHELRTPVAALVTTLEVSLRRLRDAESYRQTLETCLGDARLLRRLVDALMEQARSEIGAFNEQAVTVNISELLNQCADLMQASAAEKAIRIDRAIEEGISLTIQPSRLRQAVLGLIENAIDHGKNGMRIQVQACVENSALRITIRDTGPGIPAEHLPHIFEPFYRANASRQATGHLGLGLYLVKSHVDALGGSCRVCSELGSGTAFDILLPMRQKTEKTVEAALVGS